VQRAGRNFTVDVAADGEGLISHAGVALLGEVADRVGLTRGFSNALLGVRERRGRHDPGQVIRDLAVMLADGGDCLSDLRAVRDHEPLFGPVASDSTAFRLIDRIASEAALLIGHPRLVVASTAVGRGPALLAPQLGGPRQDQPLPAEVRCRKRQQDVAPV
jgi:Transposase DDE domain group 1